MSCGATEKEGNPGTDKGSSWGKPGVQNYSEQRSRKVLRALQEGSLVTGHGQVIQEAPQGRKTQKMPEALWVQMHSHTSKAPAVKLYWWWLWFFSGWQQTDQHRESEIKEEATITRTRTASQQGAPGDDVLQEPKEGVPQTNPQRPGQLTVLRFSLLSRTQRKMCKAGNTQMEKDLYA